MEFLSLKEAEYIILCGGDDPWICNDCSNFQFSDSFFENDVSTASEINDSINCDIFEQLSSARWKHPKRFICAYLNINSLRHKFDYIKDLLIKKSVDLLFIAETKLDDLFVNAQFMVDNYHLWRADRTQKRGGVAAYLRSEIAGDRKSDLDFKHIEGINIEVNLNGNELLMSGADKPPSMSDELFEQDCTLGLDKISKNYEHFILLGDFNMLNGPKNEKN